MRFAPPQPAAVRECQSASTERGSGEERRERDSLGFFPPSGPLRRRVGPARYGRDQKFMLYTRV